jgi:hypothetical protein
MASTDENSTSTRNNPLQVALKPVQLGGMLPYRHPVSGFAHPAAVGVWGHKLPELIFGQLDFDLRSRQPLAQFDRLIKSGPASA